nr:hypothetical protein [uncultured Lichenicoccus sp.]
MASAEREIFFVYENPVCWDVLDAAPGFTRWFAARVACDAHERGHSAEDDDTAVIWVPAVRPASPMPAPTPSLWKRCRDGGWNCRPAL